MLICQMYRLDKRNLDLDVDATVVFVKRDGLGQELQLSEGNATESWFMRYTYLGRQDYSLQEDQGTHFGVAQVDVYDTTIRSAVSLRVEWRTAHEQLVHEHSQGPSVYSFIVLLAGHQETGGIQRRRS